MIFLFLAVVFFSNESWATDRVVDHSPFPAVAPLPAGMSPRLLPAVAPPAARVIELPAVRPSTGPSQRSLNTTHIDPAENTPKRHPVLSKSACAKQYTKCSVISCFFCRSWFRTGAFLGSVATAGLAGVAYGITDPSTKDKLTLAVLILTVVTTALKQFEDYAVKELKSDEDEFGMFV